jgi:hypothetical protein
VPTLPYPSISPATSGKKQYGRLAKSPPLRSPSSRLITRLAKLLEEEHNLKKSSLEKHVVHWGFIKTDYPPLFIVHVGCAGL